MNTLPNFFIIGAAKSGTTTLYDALKNHPKIFMPFNKEPSFFNNDERYARGVEWYSQTFFNDSSEFPMRGEASPGYLFWSEKVVQRIQETYHDIPPKFIAIFRDPVVRAYSAYWHLRHYGGETLTFRESLIAEADRLEKNGDHLQATGFIKYAYFKGGCYASQLRPFINAFPKENFLFLLTEDLQFNFSQTMHAIYEFLNVKSLDHTSTTASNPAKKMRSMKIYHLIRGRSYLKELIKPFLTLSFRYKVKLALQKINMTKTTYPPLAADLAESLRIRYLDEISALEQIIGRDLSAWVKEPSIKTNSKAIDESSII